MPDMRGKNVVITGVLPVARHVAIRVIKARGARVTNSVSRRTDYLIRAEYNYADNAKYEEAQRLGIEILTYNEWLMLADQTDYQARPVHQNVVFNEVLEPVHVNEVPEDEVIENYLEPLVEELETDAVVIRNRLMELAKVCPMSSDGVGWQWDDAYKGEKIGRAFYSDGAGNEDSVIFVPPKHEQHKTKVLVFTYDSESGLNTYGSTPPVGQVVFKGVPLELQEVIDSGVLAWDWDDITPKTTYATAAIWLNFYGNKWDYNPNAYITEHGGFAPIADVLKQRTDEEWREWLEEYMAE